MKKTPGYGRSPTKEGKTLKLKGNAAHLDTPAECPGPDVPCHHSTCEAIPGSDGTPIFEDHANCTNHDPVNDSGNPSNRMTVTTNKHPGGNTFVVSVVEMVPDVESKVTVVEAIENH